MDDLEGNASTAGSSSRFRENVDDQRRIRAGGRGGRPFLFRFYPEALIIGAIVVLAWINAAFLLL